MCPLQTTATKLSDLRPGPGCQGRFNREKEVEHTRLYLFDIMQSAQMKHQHFHFSCFFVFFVAPKEISSSDLTLTCGLC